MCAYSFKYTNVIYTKLEVSTIFLFDQSDNSSVLLLVQNVHEGHLLLFFIAKTFIILKFFITIQAVKGKYHLLSHPSNQIYKFVNKKLSTFKAQAPRRHHYCLVLNESKMWTHMVRTWRCNISHSNVIGWIISQK